MLMRKLLATISALALFAPTLAFAAAVTLTTDVILTVGGVTVNVYGGSSTLSTITVDSSSFAFTIGPGELVQVSSEGKTLSSNAQAAYVTGSSCSSTLSTVTFQSPNTNTTITVTP